MINPNQYHWRALFMVARIQGYSQRRIARETSIDSGTLGAYATYSHSRLKMIPRPKNAETLIEYLTPRIPAHLIRLCTKPEFES